MMFSFRIIAVPLFVYLHTIMITKQYSESRSRTIQLSNSLRETIEKISHSKNALLCTQMKSDFLYSSLDLIKEKCDTSPEDAETLTVALSKYLRHTLNFQQLKGIVPLQNEIELTKSYITIEAFKNPHIIFEYRIPDPLPEIYIPPLSIQPLVENAINHGMKDSSHKGRIIVTIIKYRDYYHIDVSDEGCGIAPEQLKLLPDSLSATAHVGLYSIHSRLISLFGKGLVMQSAPGIGTSVSFVVPPITKPEVLEGENV